MDKVLEKWNSVLQGLHTKAGDFAIHLSSRVQETGDGRSMEQADSGTRQISELWVP